eukprot:Hpha_TRINITY_DN16614_c0_g1::TRINITY_DN16614_c0_g1_i1::g.180725::m.180725
MESVKLGAVCAIGLQLTGINAVMFYSAHFVGDSPDGRAKGGVQVAVWNFVTTLLAIRLVERLGRRPLLVGSMFVLTLSLLVLPLVPASWRLGVVAVYVAAFELGPGTLFWVVCNEIFPGWAAPAVFPWINALQWGLALGVTMIF